MRIFVTGALGFIGAHFVERALADGHEIRGLYRGPQPGQTELLRKFTALGAQLTPGDVLEPETYAAWLKDVDCICHFAAAFKGSSHTDEDFHRINVTGTERVLAAGAAASVKRFVFCSTAGIYGQRLAGVTTEAAPAQPWNGYERSKHAAEELLRKHATQFAIEYVILRPSVVYGPRDDRLLKLFRSAAKGRFPLFGAGEGRRHMVYVTDVADAFLLGCKSPDAANQEMIIAGPDAVPLHAMLNVLAEVVQRASCGPRLPLAPMLVLAAIVEDGCKLLRINPPLYRRRMDFYRSDAAFDCARAQRVLGWSPRIDLREGFARTYEHSRQPATLSAQIASYALAAITLICDSALMGTGWVAV
ncbi:MAG: NAD-dependent epimerase/dehydratase family protein [Povalibacter sp.]